MSRHVIVTGASRGIGAAIAQWFIDHGDRVVALSRSGEAPSGCAKTFSVDVANSSAVNDAVKAAIAEFGPVEVAVMNAGVTRDGLAMRMSDDQWREVLSTDLDGAFYGARATMAVSYTHLDVYKRQVPEVGIGRVARQVQDSLGHDHLPRGTR